MANGEPTPLAPNAKVIPGHESPMRRLFSDAHGLSYYPLQSLEEAKSYADGIVILEGDDGGQIYVVAPASRVQCPEGTLRLLLEQIDEIAWPNNEGTEARVSYERRAVGKGVPGGMGGGAVTGDFWVHSELAARQLGPAICAVLSGVLPSISPDIMRSNTPIEVTDGVSLTYDEFRGRLLLGIERTIDRAQHDVADQLPRDYCLCLMPFRMQGRSRRVTLDEALQTLYVDGTFPPSMNVYMFGIVEGRSLIYLYPYGRRYIQMIEHKREQEYDGTAPFSPRGLNPRLKSRRQLPLSYQDLERS